MTSNQTMDYYVRPRHIYSHSRTCTRSGVRRRISILVAFHICYLLDHASVHDISALMIWFQCMSDIFSHYGDLDPLYIFSFYGHIDPLYIFIMEILIYCILYVVMTTHVTFCISWLFMAIVLLCIQDCYMQRLIIVLYYWMAGSSTWFFITPLLGCIYNVFRPSCYPTELTH